MTISRTTLAAVGVAGLLAAGAAIPAIAQDGADDTTTSETTRSFGPRHGDHRQAFAEALADELDLDADTVAAAMAAVHDEFQAARHAEMQARMQARLDERVASGALTQEEADTLAGIAERGPIGGMLGRPGPRGHHGPGARGPGSGWADAPSS